MRNEIIELVGEVYDAGMEEKSIDFNGYFNDLNNIFKKSHANIRGNDVSNRAISLLTDIYDYGQKRETISFDSLFNKIFTIFQPSYCGGSDTTTIESYVQPLLERIQILEEQMDSFYVENKPKTFVLNKKAEAKLAEIRGNSIVTCFPDVQPSKEWAGLVLDFLEEVGLDYFNR